MSSFMERWAVSKRNFPSRRRTGSRNFMRPASPSNKAGIDALYPGSSGLFDITRRSAIYFSAATMKDIEQKAMSIAGQKKGNS